MRENQCHPHFKILKYFRLLKRNEWLLSTVSVVIPTYSEQRHINRWLGALLVQCFDAIEMIVVDNRSRDPTRLPWTKHSKLTTSSNSSLCACF
ncbi:MAG: glycosyltransferase [Candidatus Caldarchaeales archaeon]